MGAWIWRWAGLFIDVGVFVLTGLGGTGQDRTPHEGPSPGVPVTPVVVALVALAVQHGHNGIVGHGGGAQEMGMWAARIRGDEDMGKWGNGRAELYNLHINYEQTCVVGVLARNPARLPRVLRRGNRCLLLLHCLAVHLKK